MFNKNATKTKKWLKNRLFGVKLPFKTSISGMMLRLAQIFKELECWSWNSTDFNEWVGGGVRESWQRSPDQIEKLQVQVL